MQEPEAKTTVALAPGSQLDLVCNEFVMHEKTRQSGGLKIRSMRTTCRTFFFPLILLPLLLIIFGSAWVFTAEANGLIGLSWLIVGWLIAGCAFYQNMPRLLKPFPTNIMIDSSGLRLGWRFRHNDVSNDIPWKAITHVSAEPSWSGAGLGLNIDVALHMVPKNQRLALQLQTCGIWAGGWPWKQTADGYDTGTLSLQFPLNALTLEADEFRLISALKECVDAAVLTHDFKDLSESNNAPTFTQLWLDDMQSFRRNRIDELELGTQLQDGKYTIKEKIATGGQAKIYSAVDSETNQPVAVKELVLPIHAGAQVRNRAFGNVKNEAMMLGTLSHPGIVKLLDNFVEDHRAYLVLEHISGRTLRKTVQEDGPFATDEIVPIAMQICDVLQYLHSQSPPVVHRDLTPDNLMLSDGDAKRVRLLDFNVAQQLESNSTKTVVGKHNYMAPEQFKGKPCTQSDLYSLGCTLFFLCTGADPLPLSASRPSSRCPSVPAAIDDLIFKLTQPKLEDRYTEIGAVTEDLETLRSVLEKL
jgi:hypothetical protein